MNLDIAISAQPIDSQRALPKDIIGPAGAIAEFCGIVRGTEEGQPIAALEYEAYSPMAENVIRRILDELGQLHPCLLVRVRHRVGIVPVGEAVVHVTVASQHRAEAFAMATAFMDRLKKDVPIWKCRVLFS